MTGCNLTGNDVSWTDGTASTGYYFAVSFGDEFGSNRWEGIAPPDARDVMLPSSQPVSTWSLFAVQGYSNSGIASYDDWRQEPGLWQARPDEVVGMNRCDLGLVPFEAH